MAEFVGQRLRIKTDESSYEGIVHSIDPVKQRLTLSKVLSCADGKPPKRLHGFHNFFGHELNNLEILKDKASTNEGLPEKEEKEKDVGKKRENGVELNDSHHHRRCRHHHSAPANETPNNEPPKERATVSKSSLKQQPSQTAAISAVFKHAVRHAGMQVKNTKKPANVVTRDASDEGTTMLHRSPLAPEKYLMEDYYSDDDVDEVSPHNPPKTVIMQEYGDRFNNAIKYISSQRVVGLSCEGIHVGRHGKVCWLVIGCRQFTYLFDVMSLGASCFDEGLGDILENANILKVIHDCRQISDALYHQYSIKIVNVFDTQVADIIIYQKEKGGQLPRVVSGLVGCLYEYLNLSPEECHFQKIRINHMQKDEHIWSKRPLSQQLLDACAKHVMYLRELRLAQMERMLAEFLFGVDIYLSIIRDDKDYKLPDKKNMNKSRLVPQEFQKLYRFQHRKRNRKFDEEVDDGIGEDDDPRQRNAWQEGQVFTETYKGKYGRLREQSSRPDPIEPPGHGSYGGGVTEVGTSEPPSSFTDDRQQNYTADESGGSGDESSASLGEDVGADYSDCSDTSSKYPRFPGKYQNERFDEAREKGAQANSGITQDLNSNFTDSRHQGVHDPLNFFDNENAFQLHFRNPEEICSLRPVEEKKPDSLFVSGQRSASVKRYSSPPQPCAVKNTTSRLDQLNFSDEDFPPLGSFQSSSCPLTPPKSRTNVGLHSDSSFFPSKVRENTRTLPLASRGQSSKIGLTDSRSVANTIRDNTRTLPVATRGQSPLGSDSIAPVARGRGSGLFQVLQNMPRARLPRFEQTNELSGGLGSTYEVGREVHTFPTDDELFASPEITRVSDPDSVRGGTRVWVRKT